MTQESHATAIARLQEDLPRVHASIVQVLNHAYRLGDVGTKHSLEGIARTDMRHYKWLAERVVALGGVPTLERAPVFSEAAAPTIWLGRDLSDVESAIARYEANALEASTLLPPAEAEAFHVLYNRLLDDKRYQRESLQRMVASWQDHDTLPALPPESDAKLHGFLEYAIGHEYEVVLQYLHHAFLLDDQLASRQLEDIAIDEMKHLGWLSEKTLDHGKCPYWNAKRLDLEGDAVTMLKLDQAREIEVEADYQQMTAAMTDPSIRRLFDRIGEHEKFHTVTLDALIDRLEGQAATSSGVPPAALLQTGGPTPEPLAPVPPSDTPPVRPAPISVGSLLGKPQP